MSKTRNNPIHPKWNHKSTTFLAKEIRRDRRDALALKKNPCAAKREGTVDSINKPE